MKKLNLVLLFLIILIVGFIFLNSKDNSASEKSLPKTITYEDADKVKQLFFNGATTEALIKELGKPHEVSNSDNGTGEEFWHYKNSDTGVYIYITIKNDKIVAYSASKSR